jgi:carbamoyl-phosphate synthase large subunit
LINKIYERDAPYPNILDMLNAKELRLVMNTPLGKRSENDDSYIRKICVRLEIPYLTTIAAAKAFAKGLLERRDDATDSVKSLQEYHRMLL